MLCDEPLRARLAAAALEASRRYDVRACVLAMQQLYDELLAPRSR
jgi:hypothetical protein